MTGVANIGSHRRSLSVKRDCFRNVTNGAPDSNENQRIRGWLTDFQKQVNQSQKTPSIGTSLTTEMFGNPLRSRQTRFRSLQSIALNECIM